MKTTMVILMAFVAMGAMTLKAQSLMNINFNDGTTQNIDVSTIRDITWTLTEVEDNMINGHEYVDLGVKNAQGKTIYWAKCNVGASRPYEYGDYFAWGETEPKDVYTWGSYKWCNGSENTLVKYNTDIEKGTVDNKIVLEPNDDAARKNWGGSWRMPTRSEFEELYNNCTWEWSMQNNVKGYIVTGSNGNWIFLPAAGCYIEAYLWYDGWYGYYWSSTLDSSGVQFLRLFSNSTDLVSCGREYGLSVRPVTE